MDKPVTSFQGFLYFICRSSLVLNKCFKKRRWFSLSTNLMNSFIQRCMCLVFKNRWSELTYIENFMFANCWEFFKFFTKYIYYTLLLKALPARKYYILTSYLKCLMAIFCRVFFNTKVPFPKDVIHDLLLIPLLFIVVIW